MAKLKIHTMEELADNWRLSPTLSLLSGSDRLANPLLRASSMGWERVEYTPNFFATHEPQNGRF
jgi:hypothetical protein